MRWKRSYLFSWSPYTIISQHKPFNHENKNKLQEEMDEKMNNWIPECQNWTSLRKSKIPFLCSAYIYFSKIETIVFDSSPIAENEFQCSKSFCYSEHQSFKIAVNEFKRPIQSNQDRKLYCVCQQVIRILRVWYHSRSIYTIRHQKQWILSKPVVLEIFTRATMLQRVDPKVVLCIKRKNTHSQFWKVWRWNRGSVWQWKRVCNLLHFEVQVSS